MTSDTGSETITSILSGVLNHTDYDSYNAYYFEIKNFFDPYIAEHAPAHLQHAWFSSPGFAFYGVQRELLLGSYSSLLASLGIALLVLFLTSQRILKSRCSTRNNITTDDVMIVAFRGVS